MIQNSKAMKEKIYKLACINSKHNKAKPKSLKKKKKSQSQNITPHLTISLKFKELLQ